MSLIKRLCSYKDRFLANLPKTSSKDPLYQKLQAIETRFIDSLRFLKKSVANLHGKRVRLTRLPWCLLIGPEDAGKTTLLVNSNVHFILHKKFANIHNLKKTEQCDWWVTRHTCFIDVPSHYLSAPTTAWKFFLQLVQRKRGNHGVSSIFIVLPLAEIMLRQQTALYQSELHEIFTCLAMLQPLFKGPIPCQLLISKCDLLPGFSEFFAESTEDEIAQPWGVSLPTTESAEKAQYIFSQRFSALIKKLNQQLLWRLHQERNHLQRPYIKDFPLHMEHLKNLIQDFIKEFSSIGPAVSLQGIYLTSAKQEQPVAATSLPAVHTGHTAQHKPATLPSRAYFIKRLLLQAYPSIIALPIWVTTMGKRVACATSLGIIVIASIIFGVDFRQSMQQAYLIKQATTDYQASVLQALDPEEQLSKTLALLNTLDKVQGAPQHKKLFNFYSKQTQQDAHLLYVQTLQTQLLPKLQNYFANYLHVPVNRSTDSVYAALKAYIMLSDTVHFQADYVLKTLRATLPTTLSNDDKNTFLHHSQLALQSSWTPLPMDGDLVRETRKYLASQPGLRLGYIILKTFRDNSAESAIDLGINTQTNPVFVSQQVANAIPNMFMAKTFPSIVAQDTIAAAQETILGNWVLGSFFPANVNADLADALAEQLRTAYINNYIDIWESLLANIHLSKPRDLAQTDALITQLISNTSPLLQLLQTLHDNTYFEPLLSASPKLQALGGLAEQQPQSRQLLFDIFSNLKTLHDSLQSVLNTEDGNKAAFNLVTNRMLNRAPDAITQLRLIAGRSPEPVKTWLNNIANDSWRFLMHDASQYLDTAWQNQVIRLYQTDIANRYPFSVNSAQDVTIDKFIQFFGNPGTAVSFYSNYLSPFIDSTAPEWHWKTLDDTSLPFSDDTLREIQQMLKIHQAFFPNNDDKLFVQFSLQPVKFDKLIKSVQLSINDKVITDARDGTKSPHTLVWPNNMESKKTSLQLTMDNQRTIGRNYSGDWGWFRLVNQSFASMPSKKEMVINLTLNDYGVQYLLFVDGQYNPFFALNMDHFRLPKQLTKQTPPA